MPPQGREYLWLLRVFGRNIVGRRFAKANVPFLVGKCPYRGPPNACDIAVSFRVLKIELAVGWAVRPLQWVLGTTGRAPNEKNETRGLFLEIMQFYWGPYIVVALGGIVLSAVVDQATRLF